MRKILLAVLACWCFAGAEGIYVMFAGVKDENAPLFGQRYQEYIREKLNSSGDVKPFDYNETMRLVEKTGLFDASGVSAELSRTLTRYVPDSTILVWGRVESYNVEAKRRRLVFGKVTGTVSVVVNIFNLKSHEYMFAGMAAGKTEMSKPPVWFRRADQVIHISAKDREDISDVLAGQIADKTMSLISSVIRSVHSRPKEAFVEGEEKPDSVSSGDEEFEAVKMPADTSTAVAPVDTIPAQPAQPETPDKTE
jgi:hypothetical protein